MNSYNIAPLFLSLKMGTLVTIILLSISLPVGYILARKNFPMKSIAETIITLPLVLPPTVLGFYLLIAFSPRYAIGKVFLEKFDVSLVFTFEGIVFASCIHSLPFMIQPVKNGFMSMNPSLIEASYTLGKGEVETFIKIILPSLSPFLFTGIITTFIHAIGEFGVVLMTGGSIPGVTKVASIAIYEYVESADYHMAGIYSGILIVISFAIIFMLQTLTRVKGNQL